MSGRALVTGAAGFVGQHLARRLREEGWQVAGTVQAGVAPGDTPLLDAAARAAIRWLPLDLLSSASVDAAVEQAQPDVVFHLAAQSSVGASHADPLATWEVNATGTLRLALALRRGGAARRLLLVSSAEVYGRVPAEAQPITEAHPVRPVNPYGASKAAAELAALQVAAQGELEVVIARSFNHTGPGQDVRFALPSFALQLARMRRGEAEPVLHVGNLQVRRDMADVRDVVTAYLLLATRGENGGVFNVCTGEAPPLRALVERLVALSGVAARIEVDPSRLRAVETPLLLGCASRLRALGWAPRIPLDRTLADLLESVEAEA